MSRFRHLPRRWRKSSRSSNKVEGLFLFEDCRWQGIHRMSLAQFSVRLVHTLGSSFHRARKVTGSDLLSTVVKRIDITARAALLSFTWIRWMSSDSYACAPRSKAARVALSVLWPFITYCSRKGRL